MTRLVNIALVDDHKLFRKGMVELINDFPGCKVMLEKNNGKELTESLRKDNLPDVILLDVNMPEMNGYETAGWLRQNFPEVKVLALSMYDTESTIIRMLKAGAKGYILKDAEPSELQTAIEILMQKGFYLSELVSGTLLNTIHNPEETLRNLAHQKDLNSREIEFLKWAATELTYKEIADQMCVSVRTIDGYREALFEKLNAKSRVGLVLFSIKNKIVVL